MSFHVVVVKFVYFGCSTLQREHTMRQVVILYKMLKIMENYKLSAQKVV